MDENIRKKIKSSYIKGPVDSDNIPIHLYDKIGIRDSTEAYTVKSMTYTDRGWALIVNTTKDETTTICDPEISTYHINISKEEMFTNMLNDISKVNNAYLKNQISTVSAMKKIERIEHKYRTIMINNQDEY